MCYVCVVVKCVLNSCLFNEQTNSHAKNNLTQEFILSYIILVVVARIKKQNLFFFAGNELTKKPYSYYWAIL